MDTLENKTVLRVWLEDNGLTFESIIAVDSLEESECELTVKGYARRILHLFSGEETLKIVKEEQIREELKKKMKRIFDVV